MRTDPQTLTFGVELETIIPSESLYAAGWRIGAYHRGLPIPGFPGWNAQSDVSIAPSRPGDVGVEVVSPILRGTAGLESVRAMIGTLNEVGARVNRSTGLHVHVGFPGTSKQLRRLVCLVAHHEKALYASTGTRAREVGTYARSIKETYAAFKFQDQPGPSYDRYHVLNLQHISSGHVEFRVFAGSVNATKIEAYIELCLGLVQRALDVPARAEWDHALSNRADRANTGEGLRRMRHLLCSLNWCASAKATTKRQPFGVLSPASMTTKIEMLKRLAQKYDAATDAY